MIIILAGHAVVGLLILLAARYIHRWAFVLATASMVVTLAHAAQHAGDVLDGRPVTQTLAWVPGLELAVDLRLDGFGLLMMFVIAGIGLGVTTYGAAYFARTDRSARTAGLLVLFAGSMLGIVMADNVGFLYVAWELTSITSYLLIAGDHEQRSARHAARHALLVTGAGGLALLGGLVLLAQQAGTWSLSGILGAPPEGTVAGVGLALVLVGIVTKSAQYPFHAWLPAAMVAPTPVSAYLHSATMVKAGIYLAARLAPVFAVTELWRPVIITVGVVTMIAGGLRAVRQHDLKLLLAMGTLSQLGFLLVLFGTGIEEATVAGCVLLIAHALFKATLFLIVGVIDHQAGTRDRRHLRGFGPGWGPVKVATMVSAASMVGLAPMIGFVAKEAAFEAYAHEGPWGAVVLACLVGGSALTVAYTARFATTVLARPRAAGEIVPPPSAALVSPLLVMAALTVVTGLFVGPLLDPLVSQATADLDAAATGVDLALWHGAGLPLVLSMCALGIGAVLVAGRRWLAAATAALAPRRGAAEAYSAAIDGLELVARRSTGVVQTGSLPAYIAVILATAVAVPGAVILTSARWPGWPPISQTPAQLGCAAVIGVAAVATATVARRFVAVLMLGVVGYGMGVLFVVQGAPDLALTQFAIETLTVVAFVLVLRFLPRDFERRPPAIGARLRLLVAAGVSAGVFGFAILSAGSRQIDAISGELVERSLAEAGGRNVVNVVLVDFRGLDTLGEISVLVAAAVGVTALARIRRHGDVGERKSP